MKSLVIITSGVVVLMGILACTRSEKLVIDTDAGADDAAAILLVTTAWQHNDSNLELVAITCVYGNTYEDNVERNVLKTITIANASHIPVYRGAQKPLTMDFKSDNYFGDDGFGDFDFMENITAQVDETTYAAMALVDLAKKYKGQLSILALGPLTNIAIAIALDKNFVNNIKRLYIMGGSVAGVGNKSPGVEYNFGTDPESNFIVLNSTKTAPSLLFPWETTLIAEIPKAWRIETLGTMDTTIVKFLNQAEKKSLNTKSTLWRPADMMAAATMIWPNLAKKTLITNVTPVVDGAARGTLLVDYSNKSGKINNTEIVRELDVEEFLGKILQHF